MELAQPDSLNWACNCVDAARQQNFASFKKVHHSKAVIHTYLAWQDEPGNPLGQAITIAFQKKLLKIIRFQKVIALNFCNCYLKVLKS